MNNNFSNNINPNDLNTNNNHYDNMSSNFDVYKYDETPTLQNNEPYVYNETPTVQNYEPYTHDEASPVKNQEPFMNNNKPFIKDQQPFIIDDTPFVHNDNFPQPQIYQPHNINNVLRQKNSTKSVSIGAILAIGVLVIFATKLIFGDIFNFAYSKALAGKISDHDRNRYLKIHEEIQAEVEENILSHATNDTVTCTASTYDEFVQQLYKQMMERKRKIIIKYTGSDYQQIISSIENKNQDNTSSELTSQVYNIDNPDTSDDCDYLRGNIHSIGCQATSYSSYVNFEFKLEWIESALEKTYVNNYVSSLISKLNLNDLSSDEEIISVVHDYIVTIISYDNTSDTNDTDYSEHSAYSGLAKNSTVCSGYALLNYKILTNLGIPCRYVTSKTHGWNIVKLNNKWYHLDLTWDDSNDKVNRMFYLKGDKDWASKKEHETEDIYKTTDFLGDCPLSSTDY